MTYASRVYIPVVVLLALGLSACANDPAPQAAESSAPAVEQSAEGYQVDPFWPKPLPNNWVLGNAVGVAVDSDDNTWIAHRPLSQQGAENTPPVLAFNQAGDLVHSWGGGGNDIADWGGPSADGTYEWGTQMHGGYVDAEDNVWVGFGGGLPYDPESIYTYGNALVLKFTREGEFLLQLGKWGETEGSLSERYLGMPTDMYVDTGDNEVYISDGYANRRVIVFDATTGEFKRLWGAYGNEPDDTRTPRWNRGDPLPQQFNTPHCIAGSSDGLIYVCDRSHHRIQVFQQDGTFVKESLVNATGFNGETLGIAWDIAVSGDEELLFVADGGNHMIHTLNRDSLEVVSSFGRRGRWAGNFESPHSVAVDSDGNLYVVETLDGRRVQKFMP